MGRPDKRRLLVLWLERIHDDQSIDTRRFFTLDELHELYLQTRNDGENVGEELSSFFRLVKSINRFGLMKNLKIKSLPRTLSIKHRRISHYILVNDNEINLKVEDVKVHRTRQRSRKKQKLLTTPNNVNIDIPTEYTPPLEETPPQIEEEDSEISEIEEVDESQNHHQINSLSHQPQLHPHTTPFSFLPSYTSHNQYAFPYPYYYPSYPSYTLNAPLVATAHVVINNSNVDISSNNNNADTDNSTSIDNHSNSIANNINDNCSINDESNANITINHPTDTTNTTKSYIVPSIPAPIQSYINETLHLDFKSDHRPNVFQPWLGDIKKKKDKTCDEHFKMYLITIAKEMQYQTLPFRQQIQLGNAIVRRESYISGFKKPILTPCHFHKLFTIFF